jgi:hypothetical protein
MAVGYDYSYESFTCIESRTAVPGAISGHICPCLPNITHPAFSGLLYPFSLRLSPSPSDPIDAVSYRDTKTCSSPCTGQRPHPSDRSSALLLNGKRHVISLLWAPTSVSEKRRWVATDWKGHGQSSPLMAPSPPATCPKACYGLPACLSSLITGLCSVGSFTPPCPPALEGEEFWVLCLREGVRYGTEVSCLIRAGQALPVDFAAGLPP